MFRKILIFAMYAAAAGYCSAAQLMPQVVTSEVFYDQDEVVDTNVYEQVDSMQMGVSEDVVMPVEVPAWPLAGSDADVEIACEGALCSKTKQQDNIRIVSKIGADLVVENNFNLGPRGEFAGWSGGANMLHGTQIPVPVSDTFPFLRS